MITKPLIFLGLTLALFLLVPTGNRVSSYEQSSNTTINLTNNPQDISSDSPSVATSSLYVYVVRTDYNSSANPSPQGEIYFARSTNDGATFGRSINLSNNSGQSQSPSVAAVGNNVYVAWSDNGIGSYQLMFTRSNDSGITFSNPIKLSSGTSNFNGFPLSVTASSNNVYIVWQDINPIHRQPEALFVKSADGGKTFGNPINLSNSPMWSGSPDITSLSNTGDVYVTWNEGVCVVTHCSHEILFVRSNDTGNTFSSPIQLSNHVAAGSSVYSSVSASVSASGIKRIFAIWQESTAPPQNGGILFRSSNDGGVSFGNVLTLDGNWNQAGSPVVASTTNTPKVYTAWNDGASGNNEIVFATSINNGASFRSTINLSDDPGDSVHPSITTSKNYVYVAWTDDRTGTGDIFLYRENM